MSTISLNSPIKWLKGSLLPIAANCRFFIALLLIGIAGPYLFDLVNESHFYKFLLFAAAQSTVWSYLWCVLAMLFSSRLPRQIFKTVIIVLYSIPALAETVSILATGVPLSMDEINLIAQTTAAEASGFFVQYFSWRTTLSILVITTLIAAIVWATPKLLRTLRRGFRRVALWAAIPFILFAIFGGIRIATLLSIFSIHDYYEFLIWESEPRMGSADMNYLQQIKLADITDKLLCYSKEYQLQTGEYDLWEETQRFALADKCTAAGNREFNIVVIIGESFIRRHSSLYGYPLPTDPLMKAEADSGRVATFANMISPANFTTFSIRNALNLNDLSGGTRWSQGVYFPLLMHKAGRYVYHYDNQTASASQDAGIGRLFYNDINLTHTYNQVSDSCFQYDGDFLSYLDRAFHPLEKEENKLVIYHLMGQHFPSEMRYPGRGPFTAADITIDCPWLTDENRQSIAEYDNATRYTDSIVGRIIRRYKPSSSIVIYFSDHGEDMWDLAPCQARNKPNPSDNAWLDRQFHIPFFVWGSDSFRRNHPDLWAAIKEAAARPGSLDNLGQMVIGLAGLQTNYYNPTLDITSSSYHPSVRVTSEGYRITDANLIFP